MQCTPPTGWYGCLDSGHQSNKPGHIIILYDDSERRAAQAASVFVQRGVDNVFLLSGGLLVSHDI